MSAVAKSGARTNASSKSLLRLWVRNKSVHRPRTCAGRRALTARCGTSPRQSRRKSKNGKIHGRCRLPAGAGKIEATSSCSPAPCARRLSRISSRLKIRVKILKLLEVSRSIAMLSPGLSAGREPEGDESVETQVRTPQMVFMQPQRLVVPLFQRPYVWNEENQWQPLRDDVVRVAERVLSRPAEKHHPHFLGAVVLQQVTEADRPDAGAHNHQRAATSDP